MVGIVAAVLMCNGCAMESGESESVGEVRQAASSFTAPWSTSHFMRTRAFTVPRGGTVTVSAKADFADPVGCPSAYAVELIRFDGGHEDVVDIARSYPRNQSHAEIWIGLAGGTYRVQFSTTRPPGSAIFSAQSR
jgi:hypothetical protein